MKPQVTRKLLLCLESTILISFLLHIIPTLPIVLKQKMMGRKILRFYVPTFNMSELSLVVGFKCA